LKQPVKAVQVSEGVRQATCPICQAVTAITKGAGGFDPCETAAGCKHYRDTAFIPGLVDGLMCTETWVVFSGPKPKEQTEGEQK
jgi:hypothetical protein